MTTALLRASLRGMVRESRWLLDDVMKLLDQIELNEQDSPWLPYPQFEPVSPQFDLSDAPKCVDYEHWNDFEDDRAAWIDEHFNEYLVQIEGASKATMLYYDGSQWFDERAIPYKVVKWMHIPEV